MSVAGGGPASWASAVRDGRAALGAAPPLRELHDGASNRRATEPTEPIAASQPWVALRDRNLANCAGLAPYHSRNGVLHREQDAVE